MLLQLVLDSFKMHKVPVSFALSSLLAPMTVSCPQLSVVAPLKHLQGLDGLSSEGQIMTDSAVQLVATLNSLHASVGWVVTLSAVYGSAINRLHNWINTCMFVDWTRTSVAIVWCVVCGNRGAKETLQAVFPCSSAGTIPAATAACCSKLMPLLM